MSSKLDLYATVHKGQRARMFEIAMEAGNLDESLDRSVEKLREKVVAFREHMFLHAKLEEGHIHPLLTGRVAEGAKELEETHRIMHVKLDSLVSCLSDVGSEAGMRRERVLEFYRGWNRFIEFYLTHINQEEESINTLLWKVCSVEELGTAFKNILSSQSPDELRSNFTMIMPAINLDERTEILKAGKGTMPPEVYAGFIGLAERLLKPEDFDALRKKLG